MNIIITFVFLRFIDLNFISVNKNAQKLANIQSHQGDLMLGLKHGEQGSTRIPPMWPGVQILASMPYVGLSLFLVLSFTLRGFSLGIQFPPLLKN